MKINLILFVTTLFILSSCKEECDPCMTPPSPFYFEIRDAETDVNIFTSGLANPDDLRLINASTNEDIEFDFLDENDYNVIMIGSIGWQTEIIAAKLFLADEEVFTLNVDASRKSGDCCSWTEYNDIEIEGADFTQDNISNSYVVYY